MCFFLGVKSNTNLKVSLENHDIDLSGYQPLFKEVKNGFDFDDSVVITNENGELQPKVMEWGFAPIYIKSSDDLKKMRRGYTDKIGKFHPPMDCLNAKIENIFNNFYKNAAETRHCLVPVTHFFEWRHIPKRNKKNGKLLKTTDKIPYVIEVKNQDIFWMAGIWQGFTDIQTGEYKDTFSIITQPANELMQKIHNTKERMPAVLNDQQAYDYLMNAKGEEQTLEVLADRFPSNELNAYTIQKSFKESGYPLEPFTYNEVESFDKGPIQNGTLF